MIKVFSKKLTVKEYNINNVKLVKKLEEMEDKIDNVIKYVDELKAEERRKNAKYNSDEPWVEIKNMVDNEKGGVKMELDWNDAFITHLRNNGFVGENDDILIQQYISVMSQQVAVDMTEESGG